VDAVRTWRFKPYELNNQPTSMETTISVHFSIH
jgi:outer membrane biosynthesis protein TonB